MNHETLAIHWYNNEKPGWYEYIVERKTPYAQRWAQQYCDIVEWIEENVDMPTRHARWIIHPEHAQFRFRYERNYLQFILRWS